MLLFIFTEMLNYWLKKCQAKIPSLHPAFRTFSAVWKYLFTCLPSFRLSHRIRSGRETLKEGVPRETLSLTLIYVLARFSSGANFALKKVTFNFIQQLITIQNHIGTLLKGANFTQRLSKDGELWTLTTISELVLLKFFDLGLGAPE